MAATTIDLRTGEAAVALTLMRELSQHRPPPISILGSNILRRPTINVTLTAPIAEGEEVRQEYMAARVLTIREKRGRETEHFRFEWIAPARDDEAEGENRDGDGAEEGG